MKRIPAPTDSGRTPLCRILHRLLLIVCPLAPSSVPARARLIPAIRGSACRHDGGGSAFLRCPHPSSLVVRDDILKVAALCGHGAGDQRARPVGDRHEMTEQTAGPDGRRPDTADHVPRLLLVLSVFALAGRHGDDTSALGGPSRIPYRHQRSVRCPIRQAVAQVADRGHRRG